jgi:preprotein translocase subunit SecE
MKISQFIKEAKAEWKHISWPSKKTTTVFTAAVIVVSLLAGYYLGFFDFVFSYLLSTIL